MRIPATLEIRGRWTLVIDPTAIDITGVYILAIAGDEHEHLFIDGRYMGQVAGSTPTIQHEYEFGTGRTSALVTDRTVHMMLHTHEEDDPRLRDESE